MVKVISRSLFKEWVAGQKSLTEIQATYIYFRLFLIYHIDVQRSCHFILMYGNR